MELNTSSSKSIMVMIIPQMLSKTIITKSNAGLQGIISGLLKRCCISLAFEQEQKAR